LTSLITGPICCRPIISHIDADPDPFDFVTISLRSEAGPRRFVNGSLVRPFPRRLWPTTAGWAADWADYISVLEMHDLRLYPTRLRSGTRLQSGRSSDEPIEAAPPLPSRLLNVSSRRARRVALGTLSGGAVAGGAVVGGAVTGASPPKKPRNPRRGARARHGARGSPAQHGAHPSTPDAVRQASDSVRRLSEAAHATSPSAHATSPSAHATKHYRYLVATYPAARMQLAEVSSTTLSRIYEQLDYWYACGQHSWHSWPLLASDGL
jgi:hypothetical protein